MKFNKEYWGKTGRQPKKKKRKKMIQKRSKVGYKKCNRKEWYKY